MKEALLLCPGTALDMLQAEKENRAESEKQEER